MDERLLAAQMMEMAKSDMKYVKSKGSLGDNPNWKKSKEEKQHQKRGGKQGRPDSYRSKILERFRIRYDNGRNYGRIGMLPKHCK